MIKLDLPLMSKEEKIIMMETLWDDLSTNEDEYDSPSWHADALKESELLLKTGKASFEDWKIVKKKLREKK